MGSQAIEAASQKRKPVVLLTTARRAMRQGASSQREGASVYSSPLIRSAYRNQDCWELTCTKQRRCARLCSGSLHSVGVSLELRRMDHVVNRQPAHKLSRHQPNGALDSVGPTHSKWVLAALAGCRDDGRRARSTITRVR